MPSKQEEKEINRIEVLIHPFHDFYYSQRANPLRKERIARYVEHWKERIRKIAEDPNAILIIVKSRFENGKPNEFVKAQYPESHQEILAMEKDLYEYARKLLEKTSQKGEFSTPGNRLFLGMEYKDPRTEGAYLIHSQKLKRELKKRKMKLSFAPTIWAYGQYTMHCVSRQLQNLKTRFGVGTNCKIIPSLSVGFFSSEFGMNLKRNRGVHRPPKARRKSPVRKITIKA